MPGTRGLTAGAAVLAGALAGCGGSTHAGGQPASSTARPVAKQLTAVRVAPLGTLPAGVQFPAVGALADGRVVLLGGLATTGSSTDAITILSGGRANRAGTLPNPQHDAQAATIGGYVYVFGGGGNASYDHILRYDPASGSVTRAGTLPSAASDVAVTSIGATAYIVGGYSGVSYLDTILAWTPGRPARVVGRLPTGLRYAALAAIGSRLIIAGGTRPGGVTREILSFDTATGALKRLGTLPSPLTHATAVAVDGRVLIVGGKHMLTQGQTSTLLSVDPATGGLSVVGHLPQPLSDAGVALASGHIVVAGGENGTGPQSAVLALTPATTPAAHP